MANPADTTKMSYSKRLLSALSSARNALTERRKTLGMTQTELAEKVGCTLRTIQRWENCEAEPTLLNLLMWSDAVGMVLTMKVRS